MKTTGLRSVQPENGSGCRPPPQYPLESVNNALRLLLLFESQPSIRLTEVSSYLGVASSTAHRLMGALLYRGFVRRNPSTRTYEPGPSLSSLAFAIGRQVDIRTIVRPTLEHLFNETGETVHFARLEGGQTHFIDAIESSRAVRVGSRVGTMMPANCTATGKAMLSHLNPDQLREIYPNEELTGLTNASIRSRSALENALDTVRRRGYATSQEESEDGVVSVAVGISRPNGELCAVNVSVPVHRMSAKRRAELGSLLQAAAENLRALLL